MRGAVEFLRAQVASRCVSTYSGGLASARHLHGAALLSCMCLSWVRSTFTLVYLSVCLSIGVGSAYSSLGQGCEGYRLGASERRKTSNEFGH